MPHSARQFEPGKSTAKAKAKPKRKTRWYDLRWWRRASKVYLALNPLCVSCGKPADDVDHIKPFGQDWNLFTDSDNWQALCKRCHGHKQRTN